MLKLVKGIAALAGLAVIVAGVPWLLLTVAGNPFPSWDTIAGLFTHPDYGGSFLMGSLLPIIAWFAWGSFVFSLLTVIPSAFRGVKPPQIHGLAVQQKTASALLGAVIVMFGGLAGAGAATAAEPMAPAVSHSVAAQQAPQTIAPSMAPTTTDAVVMKSLTVNEGDSLWGMAESSLGDGDRYPELYEASKGIVQADGQTISNPDIIQPGWTINVPTVTQTPTPAPPAPTPEQEPDAQAQAPEGVPGAAPSDQTNAGPAVAPAQDQNQNQAASATSAEQPAGDSSESAPAASEDANDSAADEEPIADVFEVRTVGGIGGLLAASVLSILGIRRFQQRRRRKVGERISMPSPEITSTELELRAVENPKGVDDIDKALRYLASWARENDERLPKLFALRLSPTNVELYLDEPAELPAPFTMTVPDKTAWVVDPDEIPAFDPRPTAPYPGLVTLGQDASDGHILVDVEQIGSLNISGPSKEITEGALTALAVELACSQWADDLQVTVVGFAPELADAFKTGRVQHLDDVRALMSSLRGRARAYSRTFKDLGVDDIAHARVVADTDTWTPEIVLLNELPDEETCKELAALIERVPRVGIAAITNGQLSGDWALRIEKDFSATLSPAGIPIQAQVIMGKNYEQIVQTLAVAEEGAVVAKAAAADARNAAPAATTPVVEPEDSPIQDADPIQTPIEVKAKSEGPDETREHPTEEQPAAADESEAPAHEVISATELPEADHPMIRVLGSVRVEGAKGIEPRTAKASYVAGCSAIATFLVLHPGATRAELHHAIWPNERHDDQKNAQKRNQYVSRTRRWLGTDDEGENYLPVVSADSHALMDHVASDWHLWKALVGDDYRTTSTADLAAAMGLVNGQPFTAAPAKWFSFSDLDKQDMISEIVDVAHELTERALLAGDVAMARNASTKACIVDPASEIPVRDRLRTEAMAKDWESFDRVSEDLTARLADMEDEPEDETAELINQLRGRLRLAS